MAQRRMPLWTIHIKRLYPPNGNPSAKCIQFTRIRINNFVLQKVRTDRETPAKKIRIFRSEEKIVSVAILLAIHSMRVTFNLGQASISSQFRFNRIFNMYTLSKDFIYHNDGCRLRSFTLKGLYRRKLAREGKNYINGYSLLPKLNACEILSENMF